MLMKKVTAEPGEWDVAPFDGKRYIVRMLYGANSSDPVCFFTEGFCSKEDWCFYAGGTDENDSSSHTLREITHYYPVDQIVLEDL